MKRKIPFVGIAAVGLMLLLIFDSKTGVSGAQSGIELCLTVVIPSLLPFIVLSGLITSAFLGRKIPMMEPIRRLCRIPDGCESLLLIGWIGGYPIGAQCIYRAYQKGQLEKSDAQRMLAFCNNAGPAFIFGIGSVIFDSKLIIWTLWAIQIFASIVVGAILPGAEPRASKPVSYQTVSVTMAVNQSVWTMGIICGWVILARVLMGYIDLWFLEFLPMEYSVLLKGLIELSNGCIEIAAVPSQKMRFILCSCILSFGGLCVWMQTASVTGDLPKKQFYFGKILQMAISFITSIILCPLLFSGEGFQHYIVYFIAAACVTLLILVFIAKKVVALRKEVLYNTRKASQKGDTYAFPKEASPIL